MRGLRLACVAALASAAFAGEPPPDLAAVVKALTAQVEGSPNDLDLRTRLGEAHLAVHDAQAAERAFLAVLEKQPTHAGALFGRGLVARERGWWPDAARYFQRAIDADPRREPARTLAALVHATSRAAEGDAPAKAVDRALALPAASQDGALFAALARAARDAGDLKRAFEVADLGVQRFPLSQWAWSSYGGLCARQARDADAALAFKKLTTLLSLDADPPARTALGLPLKTRCRIVQGPRGKASHLALESRWACDFQPIDEKGDSWAGKGERNEDHVGWGAVVMAAADGIVVDVRDGVSDHEPGKPETARPEGNFVYVEHAPGEITRVFHLKKGSVVAKLGDRVRRGEPLGAVGDSGDSPRPMICFALVRDRAPADRARAFVFAQYVRIRKGQAIDVVDACPDEGQWVEPASDR